MSMVREARVGREDGMWKEAEVRRREGGFHLQTKC